MDELRGRFAALDQVAAPDLWTEIERRADSLDAVDSERTLERARPTWRARNGPGAPPALGGRQLIAVLIVIAALLAITVGSLIAGSARPDDILSVAVPSHAAPVPAPTGAASELGPREGIWTATGSMGANAYLRAAVLLDDGRVLVTGGWNDATSPSHSLALAEVFDAGSGSWTAVASMASGRSVQTATRLADGKVLVAGGFDDWAALATAEIYDPAARTWTPTGSMIEGRGYHTATLLPDGKVLVAGGRSNNSSTGLALSSAELYDPTTGTWNQTASMSRGRTGHTATLLPGNRVLIAGAGVDGMRVDVADTAEIYDPANGTWARTGNMTAARAGHVAVLLQTGEVLAAGGNDSIAGAFDVGTGPALQSAELYDPATGQWTATGAMRRPLIFSTGTLLAGGDVLVAGGRVGGNGVSSGTSSYDTGEGSAFVERYDASIGTWIEAARLGQGRELHAAVALSDGRVVVAGGLTAGKPLGTTEIYDPDANP